MKIQSYKAGKLGQSEFDAAPFGGRVLHRTLKEAVIMHERNQRQGTVYTRGREEVAGSHKKPWKQKHTGRARAGDRKSPIWRGGGTVFGPKPRDWSFHMPAKARRVARSSCSTSPTRTSGSRCVTSPASWSARPPSCALTTWSRADSSSPSAAR